MLERPPWELEVICQWTRGTTELVALIRVSMVWNVAGHQPGAEPFTWLPSLPAASPRDSPGSGLVPAGGWGAGCSQGLLWPPTRSAQHWPRGPVTRRVCVRAGSLHRSRRSREREAQRAPGQQLDAPGNSGVLGAPSRRLLFPQDTHLVKWGLHGVFCLNVPSGAWPRPPSPFPPAVLLYLPWEATLKLLCPWFLPTDP